MKTLDMLRQEIDALDEKIMTLLDARFAKMQAVKEAKLLSNEATNQPLREQFILSKTQGFTHALAIEEIYRLIFIISKGFQR
jgi:chorismate mutase/prephenate dehydratase